MALACDLARAGRSGQRQTPVPNAGVLLSRRFIDKILKGAKPPDRAIDPALFAAIAHGRFWPIPEVPAVTKYVRC